MADNVDHNSVVLKIGVGLVRRELVDVSQVTMRVHVVGMEHVDVVIKICRLGCHNCTMDTTSTWGCPLPPCRASIPPLVLNLLTHCIIMQFHCFFNNWFTTVDMNPDEILDFDNNQWTYLFRESHFQCQFDPNDGEISQLDNEYIDKYYKKVMCMRDQQPHDQPANQLPPPLSTSQRENIQSAQKTLHMRRLRSASE
jgi:hypothetical protein